MDTKKVTAVVDNTDERADLLLSRVTGSTRSLIAWHIENGFVTVVGKPIKKSAKFKLGDEVVIDFQPEPEIDLTPKDIYFEIVYDHENYAVIDKPAYLTVHPAAGHYDDTLVNALLYKFKIDFADDDCRPGIVHRLDKDTSGLLVIAKNYDAKLKLSKLFADRQVSKKYLAVMHGVFNKDSVTVDKAVARDRLNRKRMAVDDDGKNAVSIFHLKEQYKEAFLSEVEILTGRTHQIRLHAKYLKHPLVGDTLYGGRVVYGFERQALHSHYISFTCPYSDKLIELSAPMHEDMLKLIDKLKTAK